MQHCAGKKRHINELNSVFDPPEKSYELFHMTPSTWKRGPKKRPYQKKNKVYSQSLEHPRDKEQCLMLTNIPIKRTSYFDELLK